MTTVPCPHCGRDFAPHLLDKHVRACLDNPSVRAAVAAALPDPERPGHARRYTAYNALRALYGAPYSDVLTARFGSWSAACAAFGLLPSDATQRVQCPHCGRTVGAVNSDRHILRCVERAGVRERVRAVMDADATGVGTTARGYGALAAAYNARATAAERVPGERILLEQFGEWARVLDWVGLEKPRVASSPVHVRDAREAAAVAEVAAALEADRALQRYEHERGLEVCRVRQLAHGVAYELR